jgi:tRNA threonylcarbamoyladenosine modification (KEOPS) complex  Pcc1 subunit
LIRSVLIIHLDSKKTAEAVDSALSADNINLPGRMKISQTRRLDKLRITVEVEDIEQLATLISTLDEFLVHAQTAIKVLE